MAIFGQKVAIGIIPLCKHVVAKVTLVPCSVDLTGKRDKVGHREVTINNARIINVACPKSPVTRTFYSECRALTKQSY